MLWKSHTHKHVTEISVVIFNLCESTLNNVRILLYFSNYLSSSIWLIESLTHMQTPSVSFIHTHTLKNIHLYSLYLLSFNILIPLSVVIHHLSAFCPTLVCYSLTIIFRHVGEMLICLADFAAKWGWCSIILLHCLFSNPFYYSFIFFSSSRVCYTAAVHECI